MKTTLLFLSVFLSVSLFGQRSVYLCQGNYSYAFHSRSNCVGLNNCRTRLLETSETNAFYSYKRKYCCRCWSGVEDCYDEQTNNKGSVDLNFYNESLRRSQELYDSRLANIQQIWGKLLTTTIINKQNKIIWDRMKNKVDYDLRQSLHLYDLTVKSNYEYWVNRILDPYKVSSISAEAQFRQDIRGHKNESEMLQVLKNCNRGVISKLTIYNYRNY